MISGLQAACDLSPTRTRHIPHSPERTLVQHARRRDKIGLGDVPIHDRSLRKAFKCSSAVATDSQTNRQSIRNCAADVPTDRVQPELISVVDKPRGHHTAVVECPWLAQRKYRSSINAADSRRTVRQLTCIQYESPDAGFAIGIAASHVNPPPIRTGDTYD